MDDTPADAATAPPEDAPADTAATATRRRVLAAAGAAGAAAATVLAPAASARDDQDPETIRLLGTVSGWVGQEPARIEGEENPTLYLDAGTEYRFVWENGDGAPHNLRLRDDQGTTIVTTETMSDEGATRSFTVTATEEMAQYRCGIHAFSMQGEVSFEDPPGATPTTSAPGTTTTTPGTTDGTATSAATPTATPTPTPTATPTPAPTETVELSTTPTPTNAGGDDGSTDGGGLPGFGLLAGLAGLASGLELARRRRD